MVSTADHLTSLRTQVFKDGLEGFDKDLATLVDDDDLSQVVETITKSCLIPLLKWLGGVDREVVVDGLCLLGFQSKGRVIDQQEREVSVKFCGI